MVFERSNRLEPMRCVLLATHPSLLLRRGKPRISRENMQESKMLLKSDEGFADALVKQISDATLVSPLWRNDT